MFNRTSVSVLGIFAAFALGMLAGAQLHAFRYSASLPVATTAVAAPAIAADTTPARAKTTTAARLELVLPATAEPVQDRVKALLNRGADMQLAAEGFANGRELLTVAYAARNTDIPFVLLKHRVVTQKKPLAAAIRELKPALDETAEVSRARAEAKADLARMPSA